MATGDNLVAHGAGLDQLLADLCNSDTAQEAQLSLESDFGAGAIPAVLALMGSLDDFPRRCAIEFIQNCDLDVVRSLSDPPVAEALIPYLASDDPVTREWTADTLGWLGSPAAVPPLLDCQDRARAAGVLPSWTEAVSLRRALTRLGARRVILPDRAAASLQSNETFSQFWAASSVIEVVSDLGAANQVVLYYQVWKPKTESERRRTYYLEDSSTYELDLTLPWSDLVSEAQMAALEGLSQVPISVEHIATLEWIDEADF